jgi:hypothetical protein
VLIRGAQLIIASGVIQVGNQSGTDVADYLSMRKSAIGISLLLTFWEEEQ